jgi:prophage regulatory protein
MTDTRHPTDFIPPTPAPDRILRRREVERLIGLSCSAIYRRIADGTFPPPLDLGGNAVGWRESTVVAWLDSRQPRAH